MTGDYHGTSTRTRWLIAGGAAVVFAGLLAWSIVTSWHPLRPRLICVEPLGNGQTAAYFGYVNELDEPMSVPIGDENYFEPGLPDRKQPVAFPPKVTVGNKEQAFAVAFAGPSLTWSLRGREAKATRASVRCEIPPKPQPRDVAWVKPKAPEPEPKPEPLEPPKVEVKEEPKPEPPPKLGTQAPKPKQQTPPKPKPVQPVALAIEGLTNNDGGMALNSSETTSLGNPELVPTKENTEPQGSGVANGSPDGTQQGNGKNTVVRTPPKVKVRPKGEWPADAPPRAGAVLVKLSLLVGVDGKVKQVKVVKSAGGVFDREAQRVGAQAVFEPATLDGQPVEQWLPWVVEFTPIEG